MIDSQIINRQENLELIATALQTQLAKEFIDKTVLYDENSCYYLIIYLKFKSIY